MQLADLQRDMRTTYRGGLPGGMVSALLWAASTTVATLGRPGLAQVVLAVGGMFIFPLTMLALTLAGRKPTASAGSPLNALAMQVAFTVPLMLPVVLTLAHFSPRTFYPSVLMLVGAHYLPFATLYGMKLWLVLAGVMLAGGLVLGWYLPLGDTAGGWFGAAVLAVFSLIGWRQVIAEEKRAA